MRLEAMVERLERELGFRLVRIAPADSPRTAELEREGLRIELTRTRADPVDARDEWGVGRAGMEYRDLLPGRLGGAVIASHIRIPDGGPVPDRVHHHAIRFQVIACVAGRVRVVYEDQGEPFWLESGDCVLQPPGIRHRVLEASAGLEVVEVGAPAEHDTCFDHELTLPNGVVRPDRTWSGQRFVRAQSRDAVWGPWWLQGFRARQAGIAAATADLGEVRWIRPDGSGVAAGAVATGFRLWFLVRGSATIGHNGAVRALEPGDAMCLAAGDAVTLVLAPDAELLEIALRT